MSEYKYKRDNRNPLDDYVYVAAFDPGGITGWTVMGVKTRELIDPMHPLHEAVDFIDYGEIHSGHGDGSEVAAQHPSLNMYGENVAVAEMLEIIDKFPTAAVVFEDFILDVNKANMGRELLTPVRLIAAFSFGYHVEEFPGRFFIQNRSPVKTTMTDARLKELGLYEQHPRDHIRDSTRHAFYFLRDHVSLPGTSIMRQKDRRWRAWPHYFADPQIVPKVKRQRKINPRIGGLG